MERVSQTLKTNVKIMNSRVTKHAIYGVLIAVVAIVLATLVSCYIQYAAITLKFLIEIQKNTPTLWFLNAMPFIFAFWGQYVSSIMAYEASTMVIDQTSDLRKQTAALEYKAAYDATHDHLTDLPNRVLLKDRLEQALHSAVRDNKKLSLFYMDLENFKEINDTLGHYSGDRLLKNVALRLKGLIRKSDTLARSGGDEFALLMPMIENNEDIHIILQKIKNAFLAPFVIEGLKLVVQASIGIAIFPDHGKDGDTLMQRADVAMYAAKEDSRRFTIYSTKLDKHSPHRLTLMGELRQAIENDELRLHFQPKIDVRSRHVSGVEALVRWQHPEHGFMPPDEFIPLAERTGLIKPLSIWVFKNALSQVIKWHESNLKLTVAVNLSPTTLLDADLPDTITGILAQYALPPEFISIEITEGTIIKDPGRALEILTRLADMGIKISIDDFGTGYSSLAYLKKLPVSEIKIDKSFVMDMLNDENDEVLVRSTIDLGHNLGLKVVAEGVENKNTAARLKALGCDVLQGYYFSKPCRGSELTEWIRNLQDNKNAGPEI